MNAEIQENAAAAIAPMSRLEAIIESRAVQRTITALIILNAVTLGLETSKNAMAAAGDLLLGLDRFILGVFVVEILLKMLVKRLRFFREPWNIFDFIVVGIGLVPATNGLSVLRALRIIRVFRLVSVVPSMRRVVQALLQAIPGMASVVMLLALVYYVFAVMATKLFGAAFEDWFGTVGASMYSLFQIMTLESWSMGIVRPVMQVFPYAWLFFVPFILVTSFAVLNLFIAILVNAMHSQHEIDREADEAARQEAAHADAERILAEVTALRSEIRELRRLNGRQPET
ncbi:MAG: ion transporter [Kiloniellales bacterium]|nr:ion transporter [Kiloniellales bacterium]